MPAASPFELSEADLNLPARGAAPAAGERGAFELSTEESSSDFDLTPAGESSSPIEPGSSDEFNLEVPDDAVGLGESPSKKNRKGPASGISLPPPADSGIPLEQKARDQIHFQLCLQPRPPPHPPPPPP